MELDDLLCFDLYAASRALTAAYRPLLAELDLTYPQYLVLVVLWQGGRRSVKELSVALQLDYGTLSPLLRRMEAKGLLRRARDAADERSVVVELQPAGRALKQRSRKVQACIAAATGLDETMVRDLQQSLRSLTFSVDQSLPRSA